MDPCWAKDKPFYGLERFFFFPDTDIYEKSQSSRLSGKMSGGKMHSVINFQPENSLPLCERKKAATRKHPLTSIQTSIIILNIVSIIITYIWQHHQRNKAPDIEACPR